MSPWSWSKNDGRTAPTSLKIGEVLVEDLVYHPLKYGADCTGGCGDNRVLLSESVRSVYLNAMMQQALSPGHAIETNELDQNTRLNRNTLWKFNMKHYTLHQLRTYESVFSDSSVSTITFGGTIHNISPLYWIIYTCLPSKYGCNIKGWVNVSIVTIAIVIRRPCPRRGPCKTLFHTQQIPTKFDTKVSKLAPVMTPTIAYDPMLRFSDWVVPPSYYWYTVIVVIIEQGRIIVGTDNATCVVS